MRKNYFPLRMFFLEFTLIILPVYICKTYIYIYMCPHKSLLFQFTWLRYYSSCGSLFLYPAAMFCFQLPLILSVEPVVWPWELSVQSAAIHRRVLQTHQYENQVVWILLTGKRVIVAKGIGHQRHGELLGERTEKRAKWGRVADLGKHPTESGEKLSQGSRRLVFKTWKRGDLRAAHRHVLVITNHTTHCLAAHVPTRLNTKQSGCLAW